MADDVRSCMEFVVDAAWQAGKITLSYFQSGLEVDAKADKSPVTIADREAETKLRELIRLYYPNDGIEGEEFGQEEGSSGYSWLLDPIDGTKSFVQGVPLYGVLLAREGAGGVDVGCVYLPALNEMVWAGRGEGCWWNGRRAKVSETEKIEDACVCFTSWMNFAASQRDAVWQGLTEKVRLVRGWGDCYGHILVATGRADASFDPTMNPWDCGPLLPILEEAGGTFTDWEGKPTVRGKDAFSTNGRLFQAVLSELNSTQ